MKVPNEVSAVMVDCDLAIKAGDLKRDITWQNSKNPESYGIGNKVQAYPMKVEQSGSGTLQMVQT